MDAPSPEMSSAGLQWRIDRHRNAFVGMHKQLSVLMTTGPGVESVLSLPDVTAKEVAAIVGGFKKQSPQTSQASGGISH